MANGDVSRHQLELRAADALHAANAWPEPDPRYVAAEKALEELLARSGGWDDLKRDDRRLKNRYLAEMKAHKTDIVAHAENLGLLHINNERSN